MIVACLIGFILGIFGIMDINLLVFHIYLNLQGMTTYQWIMSRQL